MAQDVNNPQILKIHHKKRLRDLYVVDENFKVVSVDCDIGLRIGDIVIGFMDVDLRGKDISVYKAEKRKLKPHRIVSLVVLRNNSDNQLLQPNVEVRTLTLELK